jgi:hypothetical protein
LSVLTYLILYYTPPPNPILLFLSSLIYPSQSSSHIQRSV